MNAAYKRKKKDGRNIMLLEADQRIVLFKYLKFAASASRLESLGLVGVESGSMRSNGPTNMWAELRGSAAGKLLAGKRAKSQ